MSICRVIEAFTTQAPVESTDIAEQVTARWLDDTEPFDLSFIDNSAVQPDIAAIDGRIEGSYLTFSSTGPPASVLL